MYKFLTFPLALAALSIGLAGAAMAENLAVGRLDCDVSAGIGAIIGSQQDVTCTFLPSAPGPSETYVGKISKFGIDLGEVRSARMAWLVYAPTDRIENAFGGTYDGVSADVSVGRGLGANVLIGGAHGTVSLQPVSVEGEEGVNIALGVTSLKLRAAY